MSSVGRVTVMLGGVLYCSAGMMDSVRLEVVYILGTEKVAVTDAEAGV